MDVPGYTEVRELGHGATGRVMLALRESDGTPVAIKHLSARLRDDELFVERFRAEAGLIRELDSPHTARLLDYIEGQEDACIVMELVDGVTLRRLLRHAGATGPEAALTVLKGALLGLAEAHRRGVVHRDFKPENVIVSPDGQSKLVDFGVAAHSGENPPLAGTPSYMAPEQWADAPAGPASDVYAAAVVFFECLTGHRPFTGENYAALAYRHQHAEPPLEEVEEPMRALVGHGLAKDPADRPESAEVFLEELEKVADLAYGTGWEVRGRAGLGLLTVPLTALLPLSKPLPAQGNGTSLFQSALAPMTKFAVTSGLVVATAAAVVSAFVIWNDAPPDDSVAALPPVSTSAPVIPSRSGTAEPSIVTAGPSTTDAVDPAATREHADPTGSREPARSHEPVRSHEATRGPEPTPTPATHPATSQPTVKPTVKPTSRPTTKQAAGEPKPSERPATTRPATTQAPAPTAAAQPLVSVSVKVSVGVPLLEGKDGLLDADVGLGLGSGLLGFVLVPGSALLGRQWVARRARRRVGDAGHTEIC
ncbi:serine/threonine-protein kinase [Nonomuraea guangzhouensis]|uniref:non-specific serine/threonine protein kinase n=1 Tax=Nonomuraea guangzhouensis TaxID=1291555 RepID=A0ABW4GZV6_9ACTN|nr:serine/threonine-protein kinase [Nonomuraea guangzhouensis]